jgi:hypothetical protein
MAETKNGLIQGAIKYIYIQYIYWLVVSTPVKNMKSVGMMIFPTEWENNPFTFQTTNQVLISKSKYLLKSMGHVPYVK